MPQYSIHPKYRFLADKKLWVLLGAALFLRLVCAYFSEGFSTDMNCFAFWADRIYKVGPHAFYSPEVFTDYPPGYMYLLYPVGALASLLQLEYLSGLHMLLLRIPSIVGDLIIGIWIYRLSEKGSSRQKGLILSALYLLNPIVLMDSSLWGQVDSLLALCVFALCYFLSEKKMWAAYIAFGAGILFKPQMLVFTPVLLFGIWDQILRKRPSLRLFFTQLLKGCSVLLGMFLLILPFGPTQVIRQYTSTLNSYPYAAVNACNLWGMLGLNWSGIDNTFLSLTYGQWGTLLILLIVMAFIPLALYLKEHPARYYLLGAYLILSTFSLSTRMHDRYLFSGLVLLLVAFLIRPRKALLFAYISFSFLATLNTGFVLYFYDPQNYNAKSSFLILVSALMMGSLVFFYAVLVGIIQNKQLFSAAHCSLPFAAKPVSSLPRIKYGKVDFLIMLTITLIYSVFALYNLGDPHAPKSSYTMQNADSVYLESDTEVSELSWYLGGHPDVTISLWTRNDVSKEWSYSQNITFDSVFCWNGTSLEIPGKYICLIAGSDHVELLELILRSQNGQVITPGNASSYPALFDEAEEYPASFSYRNSTYFDEVYHARTAYEYLHGLYSYENTHPPLGKLLISIGIAIFGMNPFGWRIMGTLFGIAMVPLLYLFGYKLSRKRCFAVTACILYTFDFMHFTQTRIATIDVYITFFIILMYLFMYHYLTLSFYDTPLSKTLLPLGLCGISMGLGVACKWTGVYAGLGLAILFMLWMLQRYREYRFALLTPDASSNGIFHSHIIESFFPNLKKTILFCIGFFVAVPAVIYTLSYLPFQDGSTDNVILRMLHNQKTMLSYHASLDATHPYSSHWYEWPTMIRPIWYYGSILEGELREGISAFGNPLVWWVGLGACVIMVYLLIQYRDKKAAFLLIGYAAQYLPWCLVSRVTFIYHYFPSVLFVVLMIVYSLMQLQEKLQQKRKPRIFFMILGLYLIAVVVLFFMFYPVLSGATISASYVADFLRWCKSWVLVYG